MVQPIEWTDDGVRMLDQRRLPGEVVYHVYRDYREVAGAIKEMVIRGAPAIGVAAAMGVALGVKQSKARSVSELRREIAEICDALASTRPTAVDLFWAIERMKRRCEELAADSGIGNNVGVSAGGAGIVGSSGSSARAGGTDTSSARAGGRRPGVAQATSSDGNLDPAIEAIQTGLVAEALAIHAERRAADEAIGRFGAELLPHSGRVMTQCNAGALATGGMGTALGVIRVAVETGRKIEVLVPETRPYLQGARLTAWELQQDGIPLTLITDNMVGHFLKSGKVGAVVVGADRIAANGDTANKIGTYPMAVLAREHGVPFYVAAPISTLDLSIASGEQIPIEERAAQEVTHIGGVCVAPANVVAAHPAFDVTPARLIAGIITECGVARPPYGESLRRMASQRSGAVIKARSKAPSL